MDYLFIQNARAMRSVTILAFLLAMVSVSMAQRIGIKAGANISSMQAQPECSDCNPWIQPGFQVGATVRFPFNRVFALESGLLFSSRGSREDIFPGGAAYNYRRTFFYLDIPVTANVSFPVGSVRIYGEAGPYLGVALAGSIKEVEDFNGMKTTENYDILFESGDGEENMKRMDAGLLVGAGLEFRAIRVGFSYGYGLANVTANTGGDFDSLKHRFLSVSLGYWFGDGK